MSDMLPPTEICEAAQLVANWMTMHGHKDWELGPVADRKLVTKLRGEIKEGVEIIAGFLGIIVSPEKMAQRFHETYERLAPNFGYQTRTESAVPWELVPEANKKLMIAVCAEILEAHKTKAEDTPA